jgi:hypothetical protein
VQNQAAGHDSRESGSLHLKRCCWPVLSAVYGCTADLCCCAPGRIIQALVFVVVVPAVADSAGLWVSRTSSIEPRASAEARYGADSPTIGADSSIASDVDSPAALLAVIYILEGVGRGVFEGPNRSVYADWFEHRREIAFACWIVQSGGSASIAFFMLALDVTPTAVSNHSSPAGLWIG